FSSARHCTPATLRAAALYWPLPCCSALRLIKNAAVIISRKKGKPMRSITDLMWLFMIWVARPAERRIMSRFHRRCTVSPRLAAETDVRRCIDGGFFRGIQLEEDFFFKAEHARDQNSGELGDNRVVFAGGVVEETARGG